MLGAHHIISDVEAMVSALQVKQVVRLPCLFQPTVLPWKQYFLQWLIRPLTCLHAHPALEGRPANQLRYGMRLLLSTYPLAQIGMPSRQLGYVTAFQSLRWHRAPWEGDPSLSHVVHELF